MLSYPREGPRAISGILSNRTRIRRCRGPPGPWFASRTQGYLLKAPRRADKESDMLAALLVLTLLGVLFGASFAVKLLICVGMGWGFFWILGKRVEAGPRSRR